MVHKPVTVIKPVHAVKKVKLASTAGLKHFATNHKIIARNDYQNYYKNNQRQEEIEDENDHSQEEFQPPVKHILPPRQNLYRRIPKHYQQRYAPNVQSYRAF